MNSLFINETALHTRLLHPPPLPLLSCSRLRGEGWRRGGVDCRFWPPPPGGARLYFASLLLWDILAPANVRDQSASARRAAQLRKRLPRDRRSNSSDDKLARRSEQSSEKLPREGCSGSGQASLPAPGERSPGLVFPSISPW